MRDSDSFLQGRYPSRSHENFSKVHQGADHITMEYVQGEDSKRLIRKMGQLSPGQAISTHSPPRAEARGRASQSRSCRLCQHCQGRWQGRGMLRVNTERRFYPDLKIGVWRRRTYQSARRSAMGWPRPSLRRKTAAAVPSCLDMIRRAAEGAFKQPEKKVSAGPTITSNGVLHFFSAVL